MLEDISGLTFTDTGDLGNGFLSCAFRYCIRLKEIPPNFLPAGATTIGDEFLTMTFTDCYALETIPGDFLDGPAKATSIGNNFLYQTFYNENGTTNKITSIPENFASRITSVGDYFMRNTFERCTNLKTIPTNFLPQNPTGIGTYFLNATFLNTGVTAVPADFIPASYKTFSVEEFLNYTFGNVTTLTSVNLDFLKNVNAGDYNAFAGMFSGCSNLTRATIPYFNTNGNDLFAGMFENTGNNFVLNITGGSSASEVLLVYESAGLTNDKVAAIYVDNAALVTAYRAGNSSNLCDFSAIDDSKIQVRP
jgi:hypothetical protein